MARHYITQATHDRIAAEFFDLTTRGRHEVADKIERAREMGDLKENGDYHAAKDEYGMFNDRKNLLISILAESELATNPPAGEIGVLSRVTILFDGDDEDDAETYLIGHVEEKRTEQGIEVMSPVSPIGSALLGHKEGDLVSITIENGAKISVTVMKVAN